MAKYIILIETNKGQFFEEVFEELSGKGIREKVSEIYANGFTHEDDNGKIVVEPEGLKSVKSERI